MSRRIFGQPQNDPGEIESTPALTAERRAPVKPLMGLDQVGARKESQPVGAFGASLTKLNERGKQAEEIERKLASGQTVIELDTALIDPSFVSDRMPLSEEALTDLVEAIRDNTQLSPILVRPHPDVAGRYQTAFGHRRIRAVSILGIPVRAIVRDLSDEEMVVAQGQENHARKDLSYIEKARFAQRLERRFGRDTIMAAMSVYKSDLSNMLSVAHRVPEDLSDAIGPAPKTGRRGWIELADLLKNPAALERVRRVASAPDFKLAESDGRFRMALTAIKPGAPMPKTDVWKGQSGVTLARVVSNGKRVTVTVDRGEAPAFADFLLNRVEELYAEFEKSRAGQRADP